MTAVLYIALCVGGAGFGAATIARAIRYARAPVHLRWELYPLPRGFAGQSRSMASEVLFLETLWRSNRALWYRSFPFHVGLYLAAGSLALLVVAALGRLWSAASPGAAVVPAGGWPAMLLALAAAFGVGGLVLIVAGALALLHRRLTDPSLRAYTTPGDLFNLALFIVALGVTGIGYAVRPAGSPGALAIAVGLLSWDTTLRVPGVLAAGLVLTAALAAYVPLTHMAHFVAKYFTYHAVRWDDAPVAPGGRMARQLARQLGYEPTWSADHVRGEKPRTWSEIASSNPTEGRR